MPTVVTISQIAQLEYLGDAKMEQFLKVFEQMCRQSTTLPESEKQNLMYRHLCKSEELKFDIAHYRRQEDGHPDKTYEFLRDAIYKNLARKMRTRPTMSPVRSIETSCRSKTTRVPLLPPPLATPRPVLSPKEIGPRALTRRTVVVAEAEGKETERTVARLMPRDAHASSLQDFDSISCQPIAPLVLSVSTNIALCRRPNMKACFLLIVLELPALNDLIVVAVDQAENLAKAMAKVRAIEVSRLTVTNRCGEYWLHGACSSGGTPSKQGNCKYPFHQTKDEVMKLRAARQAKAKNKAQSGGSE